MGGAPTLSVTGLATVFIVELNAIIKLRWGHMDPAYLLRASTCSMSNYGAAATAADAATVAGAADAASGVATAAGAAPGLRSHPPRAFPRVTESLPPVEGLASANLPALSMI